ncbi:MAG: DUF169 domain-containing protein [Candidatus Bathyarchaeota archaeon]|nr:DUF169 domain-containing protein [Candidatus Bathyarchaeota archaeon]
MSEFNEYGKRIEEQIRPNTYPVAVKMLRSADEVPEEAIRPVRDLGRCLSTCQAFTLSRRFGETVAQLFEDMWCPEPVMGFGLAEPPEFFYEGKTRYPVGVASLEAGANWAREFPCLPVGEYVGVVMAPLISASFEPDVAVIYCDSAQLLRLLLGLAYEDGRDIQTVLGGHSACVYAVVPSLLKNECQASVPCRGDRGYAGTQDYEMIFTIPRDKIGRVAEGLEKAGTGSTPTRFSMQPEYMLSEGYAEIAGLMGQKAADGSEIKGYAGKERRLSLQYR